MNAVFTALRYAGWRNAVPQLRRRASRFLAGREGGLMVEAVVAVSLMTVVGTAVLSGLSTTHISGAKTERQSMGENMARNQMAHVFSQPFNATLSDQCDAYTAYSGTLLPGYDVCTNTEEDPNDPTNTDVQKVVVQVNFEGNQVFKLESIKSQ